MPSTLTGWTMMSWLIGQIISRGTVKPLTRGVKVTIASSAILQRAQSTLLWTPLDVYSCRNHQTRSNHKWHKCLLLWPQIWNSWIWDILWTHLTLPLPSAWNLVQSWIIQDPSEEPDQNSWIYISSTELLPQEHISSNDSRWLQSDLSGYQRISAYQHIAGVSMYPWTTWVPKQWSRRFGKIWGQWLSFISQNQHSEPCLGHRNI